MATTITPVGPTETVTSVITWANNTNNGGANVEIAELTGDVDEGGNDVWFSDAGRSKNGNNYRVVRSDTAGVLRTLQNNHSFGYFLNFDENGVILDTIKVMNIGSTKARAANDSAADVDPVWVNCWLEVPNSTSSRVYLNSVFADLTLLGCVIKSVGWTPIQSPTKFQTGTVVGCTFLHVSANAFKVNTTDSHTMVIKGTFFEGGAYSATDDDNITFDATNNGFGVTAPAWSPNSLSNLTLSVFENHPTDLRPAAGSVLIDAGVDLTTTYASFDRPDYTFSPVDINGVNRGTAWDIGAYERDTGPAGETLDVVQAAVSFVEQPVSILEAETIAVLAQASFYTTAPVVVDNPLSVVAATMSMVVADITLPTDIGIVGSTISYAGQITAISAAAVIDAAAETVGLIGQDVRLPSGSEVTASSITIQGVHTDIAEAIATVAATVGYAGEPATVTQAEISTVYQSIISAEPRVVEAYGMEQVSVAAAAIAMIGKRIDTGGDDADLTDLLTDHLTMKLTKRIT